MKIFLKKFKQNFANQKSNKNINFYQIDSKTI